MRRRVVITGIGLVTPVGIGTEETWQALLAGKSGVAPITLFDASAFATKIAAEVKGFDPTKWMKGSEARSTDRFIHFSIAAADMALKESGLEITPELEERVGVFVGAGLGGIATIERTYLAYLEKGPRHGFSPFFVPGIIVNLAPGQISLRYHAKGPCYSHVSACSTGGHSIGEAMRNIERGDADVMFAGGTEATVSAVGVGGFNAMRALSTRNEEPTRASRPFDAERDGFVIGEGAGVLILEELEFAKKRGAHIIAEMVGFAATADAHHITAPSPDGEGAQRCMRLCLRDAGLAPKDVGYINAHGTSTKINDATETLAVKKVFGDYAARLPISSTKSMTGHLLGAAGGVETAIAALAVSRGVLPPTINYENKDPECDLDYVPNQAREVRVDAAISNSFGFGGTNACLAVKRFAG